jgi:transcription antitermination factor NusG
MSDANAAPYWATVQCQPHRERVAEHFLRMFGFEVYLPRIRRQQIRYRRPVEFLVPLFPSYCFARIELQWHDIKQAPGVIRVVRAGSDEPARIPDQIIAAIRSRERDGALDPPASKSKRALRIGDRVQVVTGPFAGRFGVCAQVARQDVVVLLFVFGAQRQLRLKYGAIEIAG